ncbi:MAG: prenyltransferase/squalene oxidase repeat-containing protein [Nocardioides sp.]
MSVSVRRAGALVAAPLATLGLVVGAFAGPATASPDARSGDWLVGQLHHGVMHNQQYDFDDDGLTIDAALALKQIGHHAAAIRRIRAAVADDVRTYTSGGKRSSERYAGALAKTTVLAQISGGRARHFGGINLVRRVVARVGTDGPSRGRLADHSQYGDYANVIGQAFAARALSVAGADRAHSAVRFLLRQQCDAGYFRLDLTPSKTAKNQSCEGGRKSGDSAPDTDVTALAVIELHALPKRGAAVRHAIKHAGRWLARHQLDNGSFGGGTSTKGANTNSTGLAASALKIARRHAAATHAARWVERFQTTSTHGKLADERGAIAYDAAALRAGKHDGITDATRDQWRRATAQAAPALRLLG